MGGSEEEAEEAGERGGGGVRCVVREAAAGE